MLAWRGRGEITAVERAPPPSVVAPVAPPPSAAAAEESKEAFPIGDAAEVAASPVEVTLVSVSAFEFPPPNWLRTDLTIRAAEPFGSVAAAAFSFSFSLSVVAGGNTDADAFGPSCASAAATTAEEPSLINCGCCCCCAMAAIALAVLGDGSGAPNLSVFFSTNSTSTRRGAKIVTRKIPIFGVFWECFQKKGEPIFSSLHTSQEYRLFI